MTRAQHQAKPSGTWLALFNEQRATLTAVVAMLLPSRVAPGQIPHVGMLPWPERAVYFLREVLRFSRRDTALLLGMSDANIDQLHKFAERRIRYFSNASSQLPDVSGSSQRLDRIAAWR
jgi:hypothetical protein